MYRVGRLEIEISYLFNTLFSSFMSLQSLGLAAIARNQIQMARLPTFSSYATRPPFQARHLTLFPSDRICESAIKNVLSI